MSSATKAFILAAALAAAPLLAQQDHSSHAAAAAPHASTPSLSGTGGRFTSPATNQSSHANTNQHTRRQVYGRYPAGYVYGTPYALPYDSESDQLPGHGELDQAQSPEAADNHVGPTIFEHNGRAQSPGSAESPAEGTDSAVDAVSETVLIFRDGHQQAIGNYAITPTKLIVLGENSQKIELSDLHLDATIKANADRGVNFKRPAQS
jgi:hypothetical protein